MSRLSRTHKIIIVAALAVLLVVVLVVSCTPKKTEPVESFGTASSGSFASAPCAPPLACGAYYPTYVPPYLVAHPSFSYLTPYGFLYAPTYSQGSYRARPNTAIATKRSPMPYPPGYKPVPGDFVPPTAPAAKATAQAPAPTKAPASQPTKAAPAPAPAPTKATPAPAVPEKKKTQTVPKTETKKEPPAAQKVPTRSRIGR